MTYLNLLPIAITKYLKLDKVIRKEVYVAHIFGSGRPTSSASWWSTLQWLEHMWKRSHGSGWDGLVLMTIHSHGT
jgi:hypothetical protein